MWGLGLGFGEARGRRAWSHQPQKDGQGRTDAKKEVLQRNNTSFSLCKESYAWIRINPFLSLVGDGKFFSSFSAACGQNFASVSSGHSLAKSVLIGSFSA
jgi:hypothetical protein